MVMQVNKHDVKKLTSKYSFQNLKKNFNKRYLNISYGSDIVKVAKESFIILRIIIDKLLISFDFKTF